MVELKKISDFEWEIPATDGMRVPGRVFASEELLENLKGDKSLEQVSNVARLPGILKASLAMPDAHQGYGFSIGGVAAFDIEEGVISPGGVGYDIDCSVRLLATNLIVEDIERVGREKIMHSLFRAVPSGVGRGSGITLTNEKLDEILKKGAVWAVENGYGVKEDLDNLEDGGVLTPANPVNVSPRAKKRGIGQLGTLGAGNHFLEVQVVDEIMDEKVAEKFGLKKGQVCIMIHCGSRGLGHQVAGDYIATMEDEYGAPEFDRELVNAPINSELGKNYFSAMNCAANFAFANKQVITHLVRENLKHYFPDFEAKTVWEVCHNIAKREVHEIAGEKREVLVMRKGATRSFPGVPVLIPGSMGTSSYVLVGTDDALKNSFGSSCHGAGRVKSRSRAWKDLTVDGVKDILDEAGVVIEAGSKKGIVEEAPAVYKDIDEVIRVSDGAGLGKIVAKLKPLGVVKG